LHPVVPSALRASGVREVSRGWGVQSRCRWPRKACKII
jgi:hypothetical protein